MPLDYPKTSLKIVISRIRLLPDTYPHEIESAVRAMGYTTSNSGATREFVYSCIQYGLLTRDFINKTLEPTEVAKNIISGTECFEDLRGCAFRPGLFEIIFKDSDNRMALTRKELSIICDRFQTTPYDREILLRSYLGTLNFLNNASFKY